MGILKEGQKIAGTYEVERFLGEGAFAEVYRVKHRFLGRQSMKVFKAVGMTMEEIETALSEAVLLSRIAHPNIVQVFNADVLETPNGPCGYFTMEFVAGGSLENFWHSHGDRFVPVETVVEIGRQICRGLSVAHGQKPPIIHRDIKPGNVLIGYDGSGLRVRVSDFGLAKAVNPRTLLASSRGTLCFKAPEALRDFQGDSLAGDVWAVGSTMYLLLTDRLPYPGLKDDGQVDLSRFDRPLVPASRLNIMVDAGLEAILLKALSLSPESRYATAPALLKDLDGWVYVPDSTHGKEAAMASSPSKTLSSLHSPLNETAAKSMVARATLLAKEQGRLPEAADLLEEAFNKWPDLRDEYEYQLRLWRRGLVM